MLVIKCTKIEKPIRRAFKENELTLMPAGGNYIATNPLKIGENIKLNGKPAPDGKYLLFPDDSVLHIAGGKAIKIDAGNQM